MKKLKVILINLSLIAALALAMPIAALADDGPQGTTKSSTPAPPPPPPDYAAILWALLHIV